MVLPEEELERLAREEILRDSKRGAERAKESGAYGWEKPKLLPTNKVFLTNTVLSTLPKHVSQKARPASETFRSRKSPVKHRRTDPDSRRHNDHEDRSTRSHKRKSHRTPKKHRSKSSSSRHSQKSKSRRDR